MPAPSRPELATPNPDWADRDPPAPPSVPRAAAQDSLHALNEAVGVGDGAEGVAGRDVLRFEVVEGKEEG